MVVQPGFCQICSRFSHDTAHFTFYFRLIVHDGFHDVLGWNNPEGLSVNTDLVHYLENKPGCHSNHSVAIVIDSLSPMMLHRSAPYTCEVISKLSRSKIQSKYMFAYDCIVIYSLFSENSMHRSTKLTRGSQLQTRVGQTKFYLKTHTLENRGGVVGRLGTRVPPLDTRMNSQI